VIAERFKSIFSRSSAGEPERRRLSPLGRREAEGPEVVSRHSAGLEQFLLYIRDEAGLTLLDLGGANQENISYITNLGHRLASEDPIRSLRQGRDDVPAEPFHPSEIDAFLDENLNYPPGHFDGVLLWDVLEYLEPRLLNAVMDRLFQIVKPSSCLLGLFRAQEKAYRSPFYSFRIQDAHTLTLVRRGMLTPVQVFNNRNLERLFHNCDSIKFFLSRDGLRDVLVRR
jgi:hypothetical protein